MVVVPFTSAQKCFERMEAALDDRFPKGDLRRSDALVLLGESWACIRKILKENERL